MKVSEGLFALIKSLSKTEKRYIRLTFRSTKNPTNYERLFDAIDEQTEYKEALIKEKFQGEPFIRQLTTAKNYLKNFILKGLRNYQTQVSVAVSLKEGLHNVEILFNRGLLDYANQEIKRLEKKAQFYEEHTSLLEIFTWKRKILQALHPQKMKEIQEIVVQQQETIQRIESHFKYWKALTEWDDVVSMNRFLEEEPAPSLQTQILRHHLIYKATVLSDEHESAEQNFRDAMAFLESHPRRIKADPNLYIALVNNYLGFLLFKNRLEAAMHLIGEIKTFIFAHPQAENQPQIKSLLRIFNMELEIYRDKQEIKQGKALMEEILDYVNQRPGLIPAIYVYSFWFQFAHIYFLDENYSQSLHFINKILNEKESGVRKDMQMYAHWLNLMVHYELDNIFVLRYFVDNTRRFLKKQRKIELYEKELLKLFTKLGKSAKYDHTSIFSELNQKIQQEENEFFPPMALNYIDFQKWIDGHSR